MIGSNQVISTLNTPGSAAKPVTGIEYEGDTTVIANQELLIEGNIVKLTGDTPQALRYSGGKMGRVTVAVNKFSSSHSAITKPRRTPAAAGSSPATSGPAP